MCVEKGKFYGFVVYEIIENKLLTGLYVNNYPGNNGEIMQEIARKKSNQCNDCKDISGTYTGAWIEFSESEAVLSDLIISERNDDFTYSLEWRDINMVGTGMKIGQKQFVAFYWKKEEEPIVIGKNK